MTTRCDYLPKGARCERGAAGTLTLHRQTNHGVDTLWLCRSCAAALLGWSDNDDRLVELVRIELTTAGVVIGYALWVPEP